MRQTPSLLALALITLVSLACGLIGGNTNTSPANTNAAGGNTAGTTGQPAGASSAPAERASPTAAQQAALEGGQSVTWEQQNITWTMPPRWTRQSMERLQFHWRSPGSWDAGNLIVSISPMDASFPVDASIQAFYDQAMTRQRNGEVTRVRWLELSGVRGIEFLEESPENAEDVRRLQWQGYRSYLGQTQLVNIILSTQGRHFQRHEDALHGILYSTRFGQ